MLNINTTLSLHPISNNCCNYTILIRGGSAELLFDLSEYSYLIDADSEWDKYIDQITFLFKQEDRVIHYNMFIDETKEHTIENIDEHFKYEGDMNQISFILGPEETSIFELTGADCPILFEIAIKANTDEFMNDDSIIIERQNPILVIDSLYYEAGLSTKEGIAVKCRTK